jgi:hypothetical protein
LAPTKESELVQTESQRVEAWRLESMIHAGITEGTAVVLSRREEDLHAILRAHRQGCSEVLLIRIYGPG